jgi:hypothetical protein
MIEDSAANITTRLLERKTVRKSVDRIELNLTGQDGKGLTADAAIVRALETLMTKLGPVEGDGAAPLMNLLGR